MERIRSHETFDPKTIAGLEIQSIKYEIQDNQKAKFDCEVEITKLLYGVREVSAYHITIEKRKIGNKDLTDDERRIARVNFFQTISVASGLGFDPYEAALADEKLDAAKADEDEGRIVKCLSEVYSAIYKKPALVFHKPSRLLVNFTNKLYGQLNLAAMSSPFLVLGLESGVRAQIEGNMDFDELLKSSLKRWKSLKEAIES